MSEFATKADAPAALPEEPIWAVVSTSPDLVKLRLVAAGACALSLLLGTLLVAARTRRSERALGEHFQQSGLDADERRSLAPQKRLWMLAALFAVGLGFVVLAIFALLAAG